MDLDNSGGVATYSMESPVTTPTRASSSSMCLRAGATLGLRAAIELKSAAKPPDLVKIITGGVFLQAQTANVPAAAAAVVGLPCRFTLREKKRRIQEQTHNNSDGDDGRRATMAHIVSPRRRPLLRRRVFSGTRPGNAVGYSPRLRKMGAEGSTGGERGMTIVPGSPASDFFVETSSLTLLQGVASRGANATAATTCGAVTPPAATGHRATITPCGGCFHIDAVGVVGKRNVDSAKKKVRTHEAAHTAHIPIQEHRLCGRLRKGTTAASPKLVASHHDHGGRGAGATNNPRPRTLFLVSGEQQQWRVDTARRFSTGNMAPLKRGSQTSRCRRARVLPASAALPSTTGSIAGRAKTVPPGDGRKSRSWTRNSDGVRASGDDENGRGGKEELEVLRESTSGPADGELCDAASAGATTTAGGGVAWSGKRVLHVRVPRPPPTSRLLLRSARSRSAA